MVELRRSVKLLHLSTRARPHSKCTPRSSEAMSSAATMLMNCTSGRFHSETGVFCSLTAAIQLRGAGAVPGGHCAEPQGDHDLRGLRLTGLLPLSGLSNQWDR